jgi:hypothetical protein
MNQPKYAFVIPIRDFIDTDPFTLSEAGMRVAKEAVKKGCKYVAMDTEENITFLVDFPEGVTRL